MSLGLREYARHRKDASLPGGTVNAVRTAIDSGRLCKSLTPDGRQIADAELADAEWEANTLADRRPQSGPAAASLRVPPDLMESKARREAALADLAEIDVAERRGELISVEQARADVLDRFAIVRTRILGVPSRVAQRLPKHAAEIVPVLEELLREALTELADGDPE